METEGLTLRKTSGGNYPRHAAHGEVLTHGVHTWELVFTAAANANANRMMYANSTWASGVKASTSRRAVTIRPVRGICGQMRAHSMADWTELSRHPLSVRLWLETGLGFE